MIAPCPTPDREVLGKHHNGAWCYHADRCPLCKPDDLPALIRDMQARGRGPASCAFALIQLGWFTDVDDAVRVVLRYFRL